LRRKSDRVEAFIFGGLIVVAAAGAPVAATAASHWAHANGVRAAQLQRETRHEVRAKLASAPRNTLSGYSINGMAPALAEWTAPGGAPRAGQVPVPADSVAGATVTVWIDQAGNLTSPPMTATQVRDQGTLMALVSVAAIVVACLLAAVATRIVMNRRRMAAWTADWEVTAPMWTRQR
jgi:hypothetical protein